MSTRFKVDEDLPRQIADLLFARGYDAATVVERAGRECPTKYYGRASRVRGAGW